MSTCQCPGAVATATSQPAPQGMQLAAGSTPAPAPLVINDDVRRDAQAAVIEMAALADTMRRLDQSGPDAIAVQLMVARINALSEALCWVLDGFSTNASVELRNVMKLTARGAA